LNLLGLLSSSLFFSSEPRLVTCRAGQPVPTFPSTHQGGRKWRAFTHQANRLSAVADSQAPIRWSIRHWVFFMPITSGGITYGRPSWKRQPSDAQCDFPSLSLNEAGLVLLVDRAGLREAAGGQGSTMMLSTSFRCFAIPTRPNGMAYSEVGEARWSEIVRLSMARRGRCPRSRLA
jgi:hypothetical protein